ncbi:MAG TPA: AAA family ATPase [Streptosporangiaceae bacterium]|jgi:SpoVK/Ycf46/Vps4 family AAA+-type ATPase|nr:AAA family ATPase [Streptosporangiaceae bacterium]
MRATDKPVTTRNAVRDRLVSVRGALADAPVWLKVLAVVAAVVCFPIALPIVLLAALLYAPVGLITERRTPLASACVAIWGAMVAGLVTDNAPGGLYVLFILAALVAVAAHQGALARCYVPCRTTAWALLWSMPVGGLALRLWPSHQFIGIGIAVLLACIVLGWRLAKSWQEVRGYGQGQVRATAVAAPPASAARAGRSAPDNSDARHQPTAPARGGRSAEQHVPDISVSDAMAELDAMIGLAAVKEQVRSIAASIEAARRRALAGYQTEKPMRHFVFLGPPGTGKTAVARIIAKIFYAFGLLDTPEVIEAHRADLIGEYLGATAIKTNELIDSAMGGVLFIDEAYGLVNEGDGQSDRFGQEAVQAMLKRAEDDREDLVIILAGYDKQMEDFLATNPGLASRFATRVKFPGYSPAEFFSLAESGLDRRGDRLDPDARPALWRMFEDVGRRRIGDDLGNGRFVRSLIEKAGQARDVRVMSGTVEPDAADLVTIGSADLERGYAELTARLRGYGDTPTVESALAELDELIGLEPVKRQVREIAAQLRVARLREQQGLTSQPPARHFVFTGPPGTGKTTVARILGRIFAALGLLARPAVIEAHRADLVGEHLGATAIKTNKLVDSAMGGVLFIDEAYSLYHEGYSGGDAFGAEATATLLKRAEDDRDRLVIVLAGYPSDMDRFLRTNPGLASRFNVRVTFPSYSPRDLTRIAGLIAQQAGDTFHADARPVLDQIFGHACAEGLIDELGNGRFARSLFERACACRDLRVSHLGESATTADLTTVTASDLRAAYEELVRA